MTAATAVLIVDDSVVARTVIAGILMATDRFEVVGAVTSAAAALDFLTRARADIVLLDIDMPGMDGISALPSLIAAGKGARIVIVSSSASDGAAVSVDAMMHGAADTLVKPTAGALSGPFARHLLERLDRLREQAPATAGVSPAGRVRRAVPGAATDDEYDIVAIGASTGGIHALGQLLAEIPAGFQPPILVTQHLPVSFMPYLAAQLAVSARRPCDVATDRMRIRAGRVIVAPGDAHLRCVSLGEGQAAIRLVTDPQSSGCMPSVDPMLTSLADVYGPRLLAIMLSGMGRDGAEGAARVRATGGCIMVQDEASSVVWGMPGAVAALGIADAILPPDLIGRIAATRRRP